jgi:ADP-glucose pyrophosphorylase
VIGAGAKVKCRSIQDSVVLPGAVVEVEGDITRAILAGPVSSDASLSEVILHGDWKG